ncbi:MAG: redoxin domain-containing protein [Chloroflexi bacterium]|nr:redoxin domain-containing protein [Chloroflexota bacterium]
MPCRTHLVEVQRHEQALAAANAAVIAVSFEPPEQIRAYRAVVPLPFAVYSDPQRRAYRAFGLTRPRARQLYTARTIWAYVAGFLRGHLPRRPQGDVRQLGGDFILDADGRLVYAYASRDPGDRPAVRALLAVLAGLPARPTS